jgi:DedD protein
MDRRVKARLVGASILVVLIVLIVPELLSGPPQGPAPGSVIPRLPVSAPDPIRNVTVDLATSKAPAPEPLAAAAVAATTVANGAPTAATASAAVPSAPVPSAPTASAPTASAPVASAAVPSAPPLEMASPSPPSSGAAAKSMAAGRAWTVQLGSFASHDNADKLLRQLKAQGFSAFILSAGSGPSLRYRVRIGPMQDRGAAAQTVGKLKSLGHVASIVPPAP